MLTQSGGNVNSIFIFFGWRCESTDNSYLGHHLSKGSTKTIRDYLPDCSILSFFCIHSHLSFSGWPEKQQAGQAFEKAYCSSKNSTISRPVVPIMHFSIPRSQPPLPARFLISFVGTLLAPPRQSVLVSVVFIEVTLSLPLFARPASLFLNSTNNPMGLFVGVVSLDGFAVSSIILPALLAVTLFAPRAQPIFTTGIFCEFAFVFPLFAFAALFHLLVSHFFRCLNTLLALAGSIF